MSYVNRAKDSEASTNLGAIFTDETAFNATNSIYISAGHSSAPASGVLSLTAVSPTHPFYGGIYSVDAPPYTCSGNGLLVNGATALGGFGDIGFLPVGTLYFYYNVGVSTTATESIPTTKAATWPGTVSATFAGSGSALGAAGTNALCGGGYEAFAGSNFTGSNFQIYAVDDFSTTPTLISGTAY